MHPPNPCKKSRYQERNFRMRRISRPMWDICIAVLTPQPISVERTKPMSRFSFAPLFLAICFGTLIYAPSAFAQSCSVGPVVNVAGDTITFTVTLTTTDPNDPTVEGGEPVSVSTSGGEIAGQ